MMAYLVYFFMITYKALPTIRNLKKTYRYALGITIFTMAFSAFLMMNNGQAAQRMDPPMYLSLLALVNVYVHFIAHVYSPAVGHAPNVNSFNIPEAEKERR